MDDEELAQTAAQTPIHCIRDSSNQRRLTFGNISDSFSNKVIFATDKLIESMYFISIVRY